MKNNSGASLQKHFHLFCPMKTNLRNLPQLNIIISTISPSNNEFQTHCNIRIKEGSSDGFSECWCFISASILLWHTFCKGKKVSVIVIKWLKCKQTGVWSAWDRNQTPRVLQLKWLWRHCLVSESWFMRCSLKSFMVEIHTRYKVLPN